MPKASFSHGVLNRGLRIKNEHLADVVAFFQQSLYLPDPTSLLVAYATYAAHLIPGRSPLWTMIVGGSSTGKTELLGCMSDLQQVFAVSQITVPGLLSASPKKDRGKDATGGLLKEMGESGFIVMKDFTTVLSMHREKLRDLLGALREIHDGQFKRNTGGDGGRAFEWCGSISVLAAVTSVIDRHSEEIATMGHRFVMVRMPDLGADDMQHLARTACVSVEDGENECIRRELTSSFFAALPPYRSICPSAVDIDWLSAMATLVCMCRSPIVRDGQNRAIDFVPDREGRPANNEGRQRAMVFKRGRIWWYEFTFAGKRIRESSKTLSKTVVKEAEKARHRELEWTLVGLPSERREHRIRSVSDVIAPYLDGYELNHREQSILFAKGRLSHVRRCLGTVLLPRFDRRGYSRVHEEPKSGRRIRSNDQHGNWRTEPGYWKAVVYSLAEDTETRRAEGRG